MQGNFPTVSPRLYAVTRVMLMIASVCATYCVTAFLILGWPATGYFVGTMFILRTVRKRYRKSMALGTARWADAKDLRMAGMLDAPVGLIVGRIQSKTPLPTRIAGLFRPTTGNEKACRAIWSGHSKKLVRLHRAVHTTVIAPTGVGKGVSCVIPFLLTCPESCVVNDFKGELAKLTAEHRRKNFGHQVVLLDPYKLVTQTPDAFNPLDFIETSDRQALDDCNDLAGAVVVRDSEERERHWNDSAEAYISGITATVVAHGERDKGTRSLQTVREILSHPQKLELAIRLMTESSAWGGQLASMGGQLLHFTDKEKSSVLSSALRHLRFLGTPAIADSTATSSFDPGLLRKGKMTVYLILPPDRAQAQAGLLRMWIGSMLRACVKGGLQ